MFSRFISAKGFAAILFVSPFVLLQGCIATRGWVGEQLNPVNDRIARLEGQFGEAENRYSPLQNRLTTTEERIAQIASKADEADAKADKALTMVSNLRLERRLELKLDDSVLYGFNSATLTDEGKKSIDVFLSDELVSKVFAVEHPDLSI